MWEIERAADLPPMLDYRGVEADRLSTILSAGIDVQPTDAVIYVSTLEKALEYGGLPKAVVALDPKRLERTWREVPADTEPDELASIRETYRTVLTSKDGNKLWCSRLHEADPRVTTSYEVSYARWIPGDPFDALRAVLVLGTQAFAESFISAVQGTRRAAQLTPCDLALRA